MYKGGCEPIFEWLHKVENLLPWVFVLTSIPKSLYANIDTDHAIELVGGWMGKLSSQPSFQRKFPNQAVKAVMEIIMKNNHFEFGVLMFYKYVGQPWLD